MRVYCQQRHKKTFFLKTMFLSCYTTIIQVEYKKNKRKTLKTITFQHFSLPFCLDCKHITLLYFKM